MIGYLTIIFSALSRLLSGHDLIMTIFPVSLLDSRSIIIWNKEMVFWEGSNSYCYLRKHFISYTESTEKKNWRILIVHLLSPLYDITAIIHYDHDTRIDWNKGLCYLVITFSGAENYRTSWQFEIPRTQASCKYGGSGCIRFKTIRRCQNGLRFTMTAILSQLNFYIHTFL